MLPYAALDFDFRRLLILMGHGSSSIDPELLLRILLICYLYGISSERKLVKVEALFAELKNQIGLRR